MSAFDRKNRSFYDSLTDEEKKKFSPYLMIRYGSTVSGGADLQAYYLMSCNERLNKHFFDVNTAQHKKLQWLLATTVSPGMGNQFHQWIAPKKKEPGAGSIRKQLAEFYPHCNDDEIDLLAKITTKKDIETYIKQLGQEVKK